MTGPDRPDLVALTADTLAVLTNRGLVKRATREVGTDAAPVVTVDPDSTVRGDYADGAKAVLPAGVGLDGARCDCPAPGACRHLIGLVLAYQRLAGQPPAEQAAEPVDEGATAAPAPVIWSPGELTDEALADLLGARVFALAQRIHRTGYLARVRRPTPADPVPSVELDSCSVRFLVPHEIGYAHTDAARGARPEAVALAVWACRQADAQAPGVADVRLAVGGEAGAAQAGGSGLDPALALTEDLLRDGVMHASSALVGTFARVRREVDAAGLRWPSLALDELADQLDAYRDRDARHRTERVAELIAELHARHRAVANRGASLRSWVLGTEEASETPLRRTVLTSLGCRVRMVEPPPGTDPGEESTMEAEVFLAHAVTGMVLVLRRRWSVGDGSRTGHALARRALGGTSLGAVAAGNLVTETANRSASRVIRLGTSRVVKSTVTPSSGAWHSLPGTLLVRDVESYQRDAAELPPRLIRPRVEAEAVRVVEIADVVAIGYQPGDQRLEAVIQDPAGGTAVVSADYRPVAPAALDTLAEALTGERGRPRYLSGVLHRAGGVVVVDPLAVVVGPPDDGETDRADEPGVLLVPDLVAGDGSTALAPPVAVVPDPVASALDAAVSLLAEVSHRGLHHLPPTFGDRVRRCADGLAQVGLRRAAEAVRAVAGHLGQESSELVGAWVDAQIRLLVTAEQR